MRITELILIQRENLQVKVWRTLMSVAPIRFRSIWYYFYVEEIRFLPQITYSWSKAFIIQDIYLFFPWDCAKGLVSSPTLYDFVGLFQISPRNDLKGRGMWAWRIFSIALSSRKVSLLSILIFPHRNSHRTLFLSYDKFSYFEFHNDCLVCCSWWFWECNTKFLHDMN